MEHYLHHIASDAKRIADAMELIAHLLEDQFKHRVGDYNLYDLIQKAGVSL